MKVLAATLVLCSVASLAQAYYYNEEGEVESDDGYEASSSSRARALYTRSVKSPPPPAPSRGKYNPPSPARARLSAPVKTAPVFEPQQRIEQQTYEQQSYAPQIQHDVVGRPEPYNFNYDTNDEYGNKQFRKEDSDDTGAVRGSYGYTDANGLYRIVDYVADENGFRANIRTNEPGLVEPSPATGEVQNPADVTLSAEATPSGIREQQLRYKSQAGASASAGAYSSQSSLGSGGGGGSYGGGSSGGGFGGGSSSGFGGSSSYGGGGERLQQQKLRGTKY